MEYRSFKMYQYRQIITRLRLGETSRDIANTGLVGKNKALQIRKIACEHGLLDTDKPLPDDSVLAELFSKSVKLAPSIQLPIALPFKDIIQKWIIQGVQTKTMHAALCKDHGYTGSYTSLGRFVKKLNEKLPRATVPLDFLPGECAQVDFGMGPKITDPVTGEIVSTWIFVMVLAWSRHLYAEIVTNQNTRTWLICHRRAFEFFGGVPQKIMIDNAKCAVTKACYYDPQIQRAYGDLAEGYGFIISPCPPYDPRKKGRVEAGVKYVKNNFVPLREFRGIVDANQQLTCWILEQAGNRTHGTTREKPLEQFNEIEQATLRPLPHHPPELVEWHKVKIHTDCHFQFAKCRYSVPYQFITKELWLCAGETTIRLYHENNMIALHARLTKDGARSTIQEHLPPGALTYATQDIAWCLKQAESIGVHCLGLTNILVSSRIQDNRRSAQGIIHLKGKYGKERLEAACQRALAFDSPFHRTVKAILEKGLEFHALPTPENILDELSATYTGEGKYNRDPSTILQ